MNVAVRAFLGFVALGVLSGAGVVWDGARACAESAPVVRPDPARERLAAVEKRFQTDQYTLLVSKWPQLKTLLEIQRDEQIALIDRRTMEFYYVRDHHPGRIVRNQDASAFANFDVSEEDKRALRASDPAYVAIGQRIEMLQLKFENSPEAPEARAKLPAIRTDPAYREIIVRLQQGLREVETLLKKGP